MIRWGRFAGAYALMGGVALALIWARGTPLLHPSPTPGMQALAPALESPALDASSAHLWSLSGGLIFGLFVVALSRLTVQRFDWARRLHLELRPFARGLDATGIVVLALLSSAGEELLFRGLLQPWMGLWPQALLFGLVHQMPGPSRWTWVTWALVVGLALGALYEFTGSLLGPIVAHALVNGLNLHFLKHHTPAVRETGAQLEVGA
ncbi:MAG TPA: CPBP family intramembrane glutamic endopeptidase [Polyangiaceae bacterium]|nr:CPBP family intramembrane glutamic endopeptidase [Polyangiaceae bacterium]